MITLYFGSVINPQNLTHYLALPRCLVAVGLDGNISWIEENIDEPVLQQTIISYGLMKGDYTLVKLSADEFLMPGLIDTHVHACQFPILGTGGDSELLAWLLKYVFRTESRFEDKDYAEDTYNDVIDRSIASGTTTSCYYGTLHLNATMILANVIHKKGQRAFVGKCNMDSDCPDYYVEKSPKASLDDTIALVKHIESLPPSYANERLVYPIITPRFALSCSEELLTYLGKLAAAMPHVPIQTHISENRKEVEEVRRRFNAKSYAEVYDRFGLLRNNTILGHGVWLTKEEMGLLAERGAGISHCPASNFYLSSGMAKVGLLLDHKVKVGLGSDVSGGNNPSMLYAIQMASATSKMVAVQAELDAELCQCRCVHYKRCKQDNDGNHETDVEGARHHEHHVNHDRHTDPKAEGPFTNQKLSIATLLYLATLGGAELCCLQHRVGSFAKGKAFDALIVSIDDAWGNPAVWGKGVGEGMREEGDNRDPDKNADRDKEKVKLKLRQQLEQFLSGGDNRNVRKVFVQGVTIGGEDLCKR